MHMREIPLDLTLASQRSRVHVLRYITVATHVQKGVDMPDGKVCPEQFRGWLLKWTNYIKGYQKRWFVLSKNGLLSYYR